MSQVPTLIASRCPSTLLSLPPNTQRHPSRSSPSAPTSYDSSPPSTPPASQPSMHTPAPADMNASERTSMSIASAPAQTAENEIPPPSYFETVRQQQQQLEGQGLSQPRAAFAYHSSTPAAVYNSSGQNTSSPTIRAPPPVHPMSVSRRDVPVPHPMIFPQPSCEQGRHTYVMKYGVSCSTISLPPFSADLVSHAGRFWFI